MNTRRIAKSTKFYFNQFIFIFHSSSFFSNFHTLLGWFTANLANNFFKNLDQTSRPDFSKKITWPYQACEPPYPLLKINSIIILFLMKFLFIFRDFCLLFSGVQRKIYEKIIFTGHLITPLKIKDASLCRLSVCSCGKLPSASKILPGF